MTYSRSKRYFLAAAVFLVSTALVAQDAILKVHADPRSAFVFVDGQSYKQHDSTLEIAPGEHVIGVYSYGFIPLMKKVTLKAGENSEITAKLEPQPGEVSGPWGNLEVVGVRGDYLVFLNGRSPDFYIGRVDEVKGNRVLLPPGQQHVYIVKAEGNQDVNSWYVDIIANRKATFHADRNQTTYDKWSGGEQLHSLPRYQAQGDVIAAGPVGVKLVGYRMSANCNQPFLLDWQAINGYETLLKSNGVAIGKGGVTGQQTLNLNESATYFIETFGPGGVSMTPVTVEVNKKVQTSLTATPTNVRYHRVGDKLLEPGTATLAWSAANANAVWLQPIDPVTHEPLGAPRKLQGASGEQEITFTPGKSDYGPVEKTLAYKITATNDCGGADTTTSLVQVAGSIDPPETPVVAENLPPILPQTASPLPLIGVLGLGSLALGLILYGWRHRSGFPR